MATALTKRDNAKQSALDADTAVTAAEPIVNGRHDSCLLSTIIAPLQNCVTSGITAATNATTNINQTTDDLDVLVGAMIQSAAGLQLATDHCNAGVEILAQAAKLVDQKIIAAGLTRLDTCIDQLNAASPADPLV